MYQQEVEQKQAQEFVAPPYPTLELLFKEKSQYQCSTLLVASYGAASLFAYSLIANQSPVNRLNFSRAKQQSLADLYEVGDSLLLVLNDHLEPMKEIYLSKFIAAHITFQRAVVLTSVSKTTLNESSKSALTLISTSSYTEKTAIPRFNEGVMGIGADLLQWGELNKVSICCYVGIFGEYELSSEIIESVFGALRGKHGLSGNFEIGQRVKKYNMKKYSNKIYL